MKYPVADLQFVLIVPDGSKPLIPTEWTHWPPICLGRQSEVALAHVGIVLHHRGVGDGRSFYMEGGLIGVVACGRVLAVVARGGSGGNVANEPIRPIESMGWILAHGSNWVCFVILAPGLLLGGCGIRHGCNGTFFSGLRCIALHCVTCGCADGIRLLAHRCLRFDFSMPMAGGLVISAAGGAVSIRIFEGWSAADFVGRVVTGCAFWIPSERTSLAIAGL